jgi:hypothetical protein
VQFKRDIERFPKEFLNHGGHGEKQKLERMEEDSPK